MKNFHARIFLALLFAIALNAGVFILKSTKPSPPISCSFKLRGKDQNPDAFYLCTTGGAVSYGFIYDPHAADDWLFRTAEGSLGKLNQSQICPAEKTGGEQSMVLPLGRQNK